VEVAVAALFVATEDDDRNGTGGEVVKKFLRAGEMLRSCA
jgi:hypothetical protein